jgi:hypothetical protein
MERNLTPWPKLSAQGRRLNKSYQTPIQLFCLPLISCARYNKTIIETGKNQIERAVKYGKKNDKHTNGR